MNFSTLPPPSTQELGGTKVSQQMNSEDHRGGDKIERNLDRFRHRSLPASHGRGNTLAHGGYAAFTAV